MSQYTETSIWTPERLDYVRMRPTAFFPSTGIEGLIHQALEIICNAIDEAALMAELSGTVLVMLCVDAENGTYQLVIQDNGRGVPIGSLLNSFTKLHTSGKFDTVAYETSGGQFGQGAKGTAGTSRHFKVITHRPEASAAIYVHEGKTDEVVELIDVPPGHTGTTVIFEPDPIIFPTDIALFSEEGQVQLLTIIQKYCFFRRLNLQLLVYPLGLPETVWTDPIPEVDALVSRYALVAKSVFAEDSFDRISWLRSYWGMQRPFALQHVIKDAFQATVIDPTSRTVTARYEVRFYAVKFATFGGRFGMVNNIAIDSMKSTHFITVMDVLKVAMSGLIKDAAMRRFFIEKYVIPIYLAVDIKFPGASFAGTTKTDFISRPFRNIYEPSVRQQLATPESIAFIAALYQELASDIESKYTVEVTGVAKVKNYNRLFDEFPGLSDQYKPCRTTNRRAAELFLVEGNSAGAVAQGRDIDLQAVFMLRGKPFNGITTKDALRQSVAAIRDDEVYKRILAITGINPAKFEPDTLNFGSLSILTDADNE